MNQQYIIKKYSNRKLYDTMQSKYILLSDIHSIVREGFNIKIIENDTLQDITYQIKLEALVDQERRSTQTRDSNLLDQIIRSDAGTLVGYIKTQNKKAPQSSAISLSKASL